MMNTSRSHAATYNARPPLEFSEQRVPLTTRFGELVDVRNRGALRLARLVGIQVPRKEAPAVVRLWSGDTCRELSITEARALAAQLLDAARHAESQNRE